MGNTYRAFISYSHSDAAWARWLHARLETYRLPGGSGQFSTAGESKGRLGPIFRDREELSAAADLSASVRAALAASDVLVVLCSPEARESPWVLREIELFRELHRDRPILAAIVRGDPAEAFPAPLLEYGEPLAADLRKEGEGRRLGFLKIVAGIAGVPLDTLVQRDAQRKLRRVTAVTLTALAAALAMAVMTVIAIQSRNEARRQRAEAEGLVEYMLTDLRSELRGVGRLDVMRGVNERALTYFAGQDLASLDDDALEQHARVLTAMGEDELRTPGAMARATAKFEQAFRVTATLLARAPDDPERLFNHAQNEYWLGYVAYLQDDRPRAKTHWSAYSDLAQALIERDGNNVRWQRELGYAEGNLCTLLLEPPPNADAAIGHCDRSRATFKAIARHFPKDVETLLDFSNRTAWLADAKLAAGEAAEALSLRREQLETVERAIALKPDDARVREAELLALIGLSSTALANGQKSTARTAARQARQAADALRERDAANTDWAGWQRQVAQLEAESTPLRP
jgi:hypothetical protein